MISRTKTPEPMEKGSLGATPDVYVFKDGKTRFDMTNLPLTHFTPHEVGISVETARQLGYTRDRSGRPLERDDQTVELRAQDIVVARSCGEYLVRVSARRRCLAPRSEEHTSELQSRPHLVCRLLLEKKKRR